MYLSKIETKNGETEWLDGFPLDIDQLSENNLSKHNFLRSAWFQAAANDHKSSKTLILRRADGTPIFVAPTAEAGPAFMRARSVPGSYWPFRSVLAADNVQIDELAEIFKSSSFLASHCWLWRLGPMHAGDPTLRMVAHAAQKAKWRVLSREVGRNWVFDLAGANAGGRWPRKSTAKRLRQYERNLSALGTVSWRTVRGTDWDEAALQQMACVEADAWAGLKTDGSGTKFMNAHNRGIWQRKLADPILAEKMRATIMFLDERPIAFSFDLVDGATQYAIASSFVEDLGQYRLGKIVTYRQLADARESGITTVDMGAGDNGYKEEMGAVEGDPFVDLLFTRSVILATLAKPLWGGEWRDARGGRFGSDMSSAGISAGFPARDGINVSAPDSGNVSAPDSALDLTNVSAPDSALDSTNVSAPDSIRSTGDLPSEIKPPSIYSAFTQ